jgi:hypothetical protein
LAEHDTAPRGRVLVIEVRIQRVHLEESILMHGERDRIDPDKWRPLIMSFHAGADPGVYISGAGHQAIKPPPSTRIMAPVLKPWRIR